MQGLQYQVHIGISTDTLDQTLIHEKDTKAEASDFAYNEVRDLRKQGVTVHSVSIYFLERVAPTDAHWQMSNGRWIGMYVPVPSQAEQEVK